ncbi:hypothetical protein X802_10750 [Thermococcus guaymasensis DSM 11113]|uniref:Uncharacterized protein n=1 Tax=Thermococcus guaymasensis DSM 11113 TaxID=1432656 RepID=A0A0X1KNJ9_9EURY|nr:hypothetical protein [Thermococcus guaymasensis]AJC72839.1 hypothetical protein X802_10750 [Thermococcus guaymasensis DSM 11113]
MKKAIPSMLVTMFILIGSFHSALAAPYWVKPGVYIEYIAERYDPYIQYLNGKGYVSNISKATSVIFYECNGTVFRILTLNDTKIRFRVLEISNNWATIGVRIELNNVSILTLVKKNTTPPRLWDVGTSEVIIEPPHDQSIPEDIVWYKIFTKRAVITGVYKLQLNDSAVFDLNGKFYGHTGLWYQATEEWDPSLPFIVEPGNVSYYIRKTGSWKRSFWTPYGTFGPPVGVLTLESEGGTIGVSIGGIFKMFERTVSPNSTSTVPVDPNSDIIIGHSPTDFTFPDLQAIGVIFGLFNDQRGAYLNQVKRDYSTWSGLLLYGTNAEFQGVQEVPFSKAGTPWEYAFYAALTLLGAAVVQTAVRRRG